VLKHLQIQACILRHSNSWPSATPWVGASSIADNINAFNESPGAQAAIAVPKIIKTLACAAQEARVQGRSWQYVQQQRDDALRTQIWPARPFRGCR
jgi:hypothetical protein